MIQALILLQTAFTLLTLITTSPVSEAFKNQAITLANQAIVIANDEISKSQVSITSPSVTFPYVLFTPLPTGSSSNEDTRPLVTQPKKMTTTLELINPFPGKGIGPRPDPVTGIERGYVAYDWGNLNPLIADTDRPIGFVLPNETNSIDVGLICRVDGVAVNNVVVTMEATDSTQNKAINGTGDLTVIYPDGVKKTKVYYYAFHYEFKTAGLHSITFRCNDAFYYVELNVSNPS